MHVLRKNQNEVLNVKTKQKPEIKDAFDELINRLYIEGENQCTCKNMPIEISKAEMKRDKCFKWKRLSKNLDEITGVAYM